MRKKRALFRRIAQQLRMVAPRLRGEDKAPEDHRGRVPCHRGPQVTSLAHVVQAGRRAGDCYELATENEFLHANPPPLGTRCFRRHSTAEVSELFACRYDLEYGIFVS